jgi:hypothetical protein
MLTVVGRPRVFGLALGSSLLLGAVPYATADEPSEPSTATLDANRASSSPAEPGAAAPQAGDAAQAPSNQAASDSHRRKTAEAQPSAKSSRRSHSPSAVTELPSERLRQRASGYDFNVAGPPLADRATLTEVIRRLAGLTDSCPLCGRACPLCGQAQIDHGQDLPETVLPPKASPDRQMLGGIGREETDEALCRPLRAGEPAQVILDTQKRLGKSVLEGTEFSGSPELLIQWIRALDEENRRQQAMLEEVSRADVDEVDAETPALTGQAQIESLRQACRQLEEAADLLEDQNLFEAADSVRSVADALRRESREKFGGLEARRPERASAELVEECQGDQE